jgi:hypothetical protein
MPDLDLIIQAKTGMRAFGKVDRRKLQPLRVPCLLIFC